METMKICTKCGIELPLSEFSKNKSRKDGLQPYCKVCMKQYYTANREHMLERQKQYNAKHAEAIKQYMKQWYADNRAEQLEYKKLHSKQYYSTLEGYARSIRKANLQADREQGRCGKDEDPLPSLEYYILALQQRDYYDGKQYHWSEMGLDRIDNSKPHTIDNVVPCTTAHNVQRGRKSFEEFCELI